MPTFAPDTYMADTIKYHRDDVDIADMMIWNYWYMADIADYDTKNLRPILIPIPTFQTFGVSYVVILHSVSILVVTLGTLQDGPFTN